MTDGEETALKFQMIVQDEAALDRDRALVAYLNWSLRCIAFAAFSEHPDFRQDYRP
ncbi:hypothetical protein [Streptomyces syringium]|uniref:hypothetical protein n=1 Tax=Streptomyces syringium TaxID=76729 RepID=UPI0037D20995